MLEQVPIAIGVFIDTDFYFYPMLALFGLALIYTGRRRKVFVAAILVAYLAATLLQIYYADPRPCVAVPGPVACPATGGFPSIHAAIAGVLLVASLGTPLFWLFLPLSLVIAWSRVWVGVHSIPQALAGFALGIVIYLAILEFERRVFHQKPEWPDYMSPHSLGKSVRELDLRKETGVFELEE